MAEPIYLSNISFDYPRVPILRRLGYRVGQEPDEKTDILIKQMSDETRILMDAKGLYSILDLKVGEDFLELDSTHRIKSNSLHRLLKDSDIAVVMAVTIGDDICAKRDYYVTDSKEMSKGVVIDAVMSEVADAVMDSLHNMVKKMGIQKGYNTTIRYSPGYNDFDLSCQNMVDDILGLEQIGVVVTDHHLLKPEKSVTAVVGWFHAKD